jgi:hypothetical protein
MDLDGGDEHQFSGFSRNSSTPSSQTNEHQNYYNDHMMDFDYRGEEAFPHGFAYRRSPAEFDFGVDDEYGLESDGDSMMNDGEETGFGPASESPEGVTRTFHPLINGKVFFFIGSMC